MKSSAEGKGRNRKIILALTVSVSIIISYYVSFVLGMAIVYPIFSIFLSFWRVYGIISVLFTSLFCSVRSCSHNNCIFECERFCERCAACFIFCACRICCG